MSALVLQQDPDGMWFAADPEGNGGRRVENIGGWDQLVQLLDTEPVAWDSPNSLSRFRAQFGEPPDSSAVSKMGIEPGG